MAKNRSLDSFDSPSAGEKAGRKGGRNVGRSYTVRVLRFLIAQGDLGASPKEVSRRLRIALPTVYRALKVLGMESKTRKDYLGHYVAVNFTRDLLRIGTGRLGVHGIVIAGENYPPGPPLPGHVEPMPIGSWGSMKRHEEGFWQSVTSFRGRSARIRWWPSTGTLMLYVSTSQYPLEMAEAGELYAWIEAKCDPIDPNCLSWLEGSANIDFWGWTMSGAKSIRLKAWKNGMLSMYDKSRENRLRVRVEAEMHPKANEVSLKEGCEIIANLDPQVQTAKAAILQAEAAIARAKADEEMAKVEREKMARQPAPPPPVGNFREAGYG